jgi:hypothetical protein
MSTFAEDYKSGLRPQINRVGVFSLQRDGSLKLQHYFDSQNAAEAWVLRKTFEAEYFILPMYRGPKIDKTPKP